MPNNADWITTTLTKAREMAAVPDAVWNHLDALLKGKFSERPIPAGELASEAMQLIEEMVPAPPKVKEPR